MTVKKVIRKVLIVPYFGSFNSYFKLWLNSCENNPDIDWLIFTDISINEILPLNVRVIEKNFDTLRKEFQKKFDFKICLNAPYKLCDYKSFYGYLFEEYIEEYDFWGYCDCDVIFGQLNHFLTDDLFEKYDKILRTGHLSFIRNHKNINENFLHYDTYKMVLSSSVIYGYDESIGGYHLGFAGELLEQGYQFYGNDELAADVDFRYYPFFVVTEPENPCVFSYENGAVYRIDRKENSYIKREVMYLHLQKRKMAVNEGILPERYIICPNEFKSYSEKELLSDEFWIRNTTDQENYFDFRVECFRNIKRDFQRLLHEPQKIECIRYRLKGQKES